MRNIDTKYYDMQIMFLFVEHLIYKYYKLINGNKIICAKDTYKIFVLEINHIL